MKLILAMQIFVSLMMSAESVFAVESGKAIRQNTKAAQAAAVGSLHGKVTVTDTNGVPSDAAVLVYFTGFEEDQNKLIRSPKTVDQKDKMFSSEIIPVVRGEKVTFLNDDSVTHNIFSVSKAKQFDLGNAAKGESKDVSFDQTGIVEVFCNIHPEMATTIFVLPNHAFAVSNKDKTYKIEGVPPGKYKVFAWSKLAKVQSKEILISSGKDAEMNWEIQLTEAASKHLKKDGKPYAPSGY